MQIVYCVTSVGNDAYEAMTRISIATVRLSNIGSEIIVACDNRTYTALLSSHSPIFQEADQVLGFNTPDGSPVYRNRYVKTNLRQLIAGPFLFLDSDTIVRKSVLPLFELDADVAGAINHSTDDTNLQVWHEDIENIKQMGWTFNYPYINGGVIWYADTLKARLLGRNWHKLWLLNVEKTQRLRDQPALNAALHLTPLKFHELSHTWNAQVQGCPAVARDANIWHLYIDWQNESIFEFKRQLNNLGSHYRNFSPELIARGLMNHKHPWCSRTIIDDWVADYVINTNRLSDLAKRWFSNPPVVFWRWLIKSKLKELRRSIYPKLKGLVNY